MNIKALIRSYWPALFILGFICLQFADVLFSQGSISPLYQSPASWHLEKSKYEGIFERTDFNQFPRDHTNNRALWDRPHVNDPNFKTTTDLLFQGEFPWLNPYIGLGMPLFANGVDSTFFVGTLMMGVVNSAYWDLIYLLFYTLSALCFFRIASHYYRIERKAALVGTLVFMSSGLFVAQMTNGGETFNIYCFIFALYFVEMFVHTKNRASAILGTFGVIFCLTQSGYAAMSEGTVANFFMVALYMFLRLPLRNKQQLVRSLSWMLFVFLLSILLAAPYLVNLYYYSTMMVTAHEVGHIVTHPRYLINMILPYFFGWTFENVIQGVFPNQHNVVFVGIIPLIALFLWVTYRKHLKPEGIYLGLALYVVFYLTQSFGFEHINLNVVGMIPIVKKVFFFRFFSGLFVFAVAILSARAFSVLMPPNPPFKNGKVLLALLVFVLFYWTLYDTWHQSFQNEDFVKFFENWNHYYHFQIGLVFLVFAVICGWNHLALKIKRKPWQGSVAMLVLVFLVSGYHFSKSFLPKHDAFEPRPFTQKLQQFQSESTSRQFGIPLLFPNVMAGYGLEDLRYMVPVTPRNLIDVLQSLLGRFADGQVLFDRFEDLNDKYAPDLYEQVGFDLLNVKHFIFESNFKPLPQGEHLKLIYKGDDAIIIENTNALERWMLRDQIKVFSQEQQLLDSMRKHPEALLDQVYLHQQPDWQALESLKGLSGAKVDEDSIQLKEKTNHSYTLQIHSTTNQILVISNMYMKGYRAWIEDKEVPTIEANGGMVGVAIPQGEFEIYVSYVPPWAWLGWVLLGLGLIMLIGFLWKVETFHSQKHAHSA